MSQDKLIDCFFITPYGSRDIGGGVVVDFDHVFENIVKKGVNLVKHHGINLYRSKDKKQSGGITEDFIESILNAEIAIVDVSSGTEHGNANVFYELGLRHAFRKRISVIIAGVETQGHLPFDIKDMRVIFYDRKTEADQLRAAHEIAAYIQSALDDVTGHIDSPVYKHFPDYRAGVAPKKCNRVWKIEYQVKGCADKRVGVQTGDLREIQNIDVWVNSENNALEMGRFCDDSVSGLIRYYGAVLDARQWVKKDLIQGYLRKQLGGDRTVSPKAVIVTEPGGLQRLGVKKLLHVAVFLGEPGRGHRPVDELETCITNALERLQALNSRRPGRGGRAKAGAEPSALTSVLFPIFGIRTAGLDPDKVIYRLVTAACNYLKNHPDSVVNRIYFQACSEEEERLSNHMMKIHRELEVLQIRPGSKGATANSSAVSTADLVKRLGDLNKAAKELRAKDLNGAICLLQTGMTEGMDAFDAGNHDVALAEQIADCFGMLGGNLLRSGNVSEAMAAYRAGRDIEMSVDGVMMTYNTVNLLVTGLLETGWDSLRGSEMDIAKVIARLRAKIEGESQDNIWIWADLGMCEFLRQDFRAAETAYTHAAQLADDGSRSSMLGKILEIRARFPDHDAGFAAFYKSIQHVLQPRQSGGRTAVSPGAGQSVVQQA